MKNEIVQPNLLFGAIVLNAQEQLNEIGAIQTTKEPIKDFIKRWVIAWTPALKNDNYKGLDTLEQDLLKYLKPSGSIIA